MIMWLLDRILLILLLLLPFIILLVKGGTKALIYGIDMVYIFLFVSYYSKDFFAKYASGYSILFWCVLLGLLTIFIYFTLLVLFHMMLPRVSHVVNFIIVYLGTAFTIPRLTSFFTGLFLKKEISYLTFLDNPTANKIAYIIFFLIITKIIYQKRMNCIDGTLSETKHINVDIYINED